MPTDFVISLAVGTIAMAAVMLLPRRWQAGLPMWKTLLSAAVLTALGVLGAKLMFLIESGFWAGTSFYGAVFFPPMIMVLLALLLRVPPLALLDLCAPAECVMLAILKMQCAVNGCCVGILLTITADGTYIRFPSQIIELLNALVLMVMLLWLIRKGTWQGRIYPIYMLLYGITRFILNLLRDTEPFLLGLPAGNFWSLVAIVIALIWLRLAHPQKGVAESEKEITV